MVGTRHEQAEENAQTLEEANVQRCKEMKDAVQVQVGTKNRQLKKHIIQIGNSKNKEECDAAVRELLRIGGEAYLDFVAITMKMALTCLALNKALVGGTEGKGLLLGWLSDIIGNRRPDLWYNHGLNTKLGDINKNETLKELPYALEMNAQNEVIIQALNYEYQENDLKLAVDPDRYSYLKFVVSVWLEENGGYTLETTNTGVLKVKDANNRYLSAAEFAQLTEGKYPPGAPSGTSFKDYFGGMLEVFTPTLQPQVDPAPRPT